MCAGTPAACELLDAKVGLHDFGVAQEFGGFPGRDDSALLDHVGVIGDFKGLMDVLFHQHHGHAAFLDAADDAKHVRDDEGRESERGFIHQQQPRFRHQGPADRHHLLLAAGHRARDLIAALLQYRQQGEHLLHRLAMDGPGLAPISAERQVVLHRHVGEETAALGNDGHAVVADLMAGDGCHVHAIDQYLALAGTQYARDGIDQRRCEQTSSS